ncbi:hypothetical protein B0H12DRAFT_144567 [Mycena haematopus]|nr:hypothetical protein B0H12DRAFT_144567 [Mycena haematopus]
MDFPVALQARQGGVDPTYNEFIAMDESSKDKIPIQKIDAFCTEYHLSKEICTFLDENGFPTVNALLNIKGSDLEKFGKAGQRAELRWALKKMILEKLPGARPTTAEGEYTPTIHGGHGGDGGHGLKKGGDGGTGKAPQIGFRRGDVRQVGVISGGTGGHGGAAGGIVENAEVAGKAPQIGFRRGDVRQVGVISGKLFGISPPTSCYLIFASRRHRWSRWCSWRHR